MSWNMYVDTHCWCFIIMWDNRTHQQLKNFNNIFLPVKRYRDESEYGRSYRNIGNEIVYNAVNVSERPIYIEMLCYFNTENWILLKHMSLYLNQSLIWNWIHSSRKPWANQKCSNSIENSWWLFAFAYELI